MEKRSEDPDNAYVTYTPKRKESVQYMSIMYPHYPHIHIVNEEYAYGFMCYQAHHEKLKSNNKPKTNKILTSDSRLIKKMLLRYIFILL